MKPDFTVDESLCTGCGACLKECSHQVSPITLRHVDPENYNCSRCYHCYALCPANAIHPGRGCRESEIDEEKLRVVTPDTLRNFLNFRRSIRSYTRKEIDSELLDELIQDACLIPSGGNARAYEFTLLKKGSPTAERLNEKLNSIYIKRSRLLSNLILRNLARPFVNSHARGFLRDKEYREKMERLVLRANNGEDVFFHQAPVIVIIHSKAVIPTPKEDCVLAGYNLALSAQAHGLGSCFVTLAQNAINADKCCKTVLGLTGTDHVYAVVTLGYPAVHYCRSTPMQKKNYSVL